MDSQSIAHEIADHLRGLDSIASAKLHETAEGVGTAGVVTLVTQGGTRYLVSVTHLDVEEAG